MPETTDSMYRPPAAAIAAPPETLVAYEPTGTFSIVRCVTDAWYALLRNIGPFLGILAIGFGVFLGVVMLFAAAAAISLAPVFAFVMLLLYLVALPVAAWGMIRFSLRAIDGRAQIADVFSIFERPLPRFGKMLGLWVVLFFVALPGSLPQALVQLQSPPDLSLLGLAYLWNIAWSQLVSIRLFFAMFFVVDRDMAIGESLRTSWDWTRGNTLRFLGLLIVGLGISLAGVLALLVGIIPASFLAWLLYLSAFRQIAGGSDAVTGVRAA